MRYCILLSCFLFSHGLFASALLDVKPSNKPQFISFIKQHLGNYVASENSDELCKSASLSLTTEPTVGFTLGTLINFPELHNGTQTKKIPDFCIVTTKLRYFVNGIKRSQRYNRCDDPAEEGNIDDSLTFQSNNQLVYELDKPALKCVFNKVE